MLNEAVCGHCPYARGCRYRAGGASAAEIAYWAIYRREAWRLMAAYPDLALEQVRQAVEWFIRCPGHPESDPSRPRPLPAVA